MANGVSVSVTLHPDYKLLHYVNWRDRYEMVRHHRVMLETDWLFIPSDITTEPKI